MKIFITGANGWLGRSLINSLRKGVEGRRDIDELYHQAEIRCLVPHGESVAELEKFEVDIFRGDVRSQDDCRDFLKNPGDNSTRILFHLAGVIHPKKVKDFYDINLKGTFHMLQAARENGITRCVVMSSNSPIGCNPHSDHLFDENSSYNPYMHYGKSKMKMEELCKKEFIEKGFDVVLIRAPWFYGPFQPPRQSLFFKMVKNGKAPIVGSGENMRSMSYVGNLSQGLLLAGFSKQAKGNIYWLADEEPYSMNRIVDTIEKVLTKDFNIQCKNGKRLRLPWIASEVAYLCDFLLQSAGLYHQKIHVLSEMNKNIACSVKKAKDELNYKPMISLEEGMRRSIEWCLKEDRDFLN